MAPRTPADDETQHRDRRRTLGLSAAAIQGYVERAQRESDDGPFRTASFLTGETVALIADWYHFAILELTRLSEFRADSRWIARVLDISVDEVNVALQRLIRLDLLDMASTDRWVDTSGEACVSIDTLTPEASTGCRRRAAASPRPPCATCR